ncbi:MAG: three-Cys-motif partner protein TcmP [Deltaproteobacteria bacterium]|nr:three-Cys-motif partner protein TcmP [Deltaproteobacteria bacterium]
MPKKEYGWGSGSIPEIAPHSLAKHRILRQYVETYIRVLTANPRIDRLRLALVDGFAGGGEYVGQGSTIVHPGSPQILLDATSAAEAAANTTRTKPFTIDARFYFVEKDATTAKYLQSVLCRRPTWHSEAQKVSILVGEFESRIDSVLADIAAGGRANRTIFVLDQYGYTAVPVPLIGRIFNALPNAEVFLTVAVGWITAYLPTARSAAEKLGIDASVLDRICQRQDDVFSPEDADRRPDLLAVQRILHHAFTNSPGSRFYTPFFILSRESNRPYWFLHMANSRRANDVVKALHWKLQNHFEHFGGPGLTMLGYDPQEDPGVTRQSRFVFDDPAMARTRLALVNEIPRRIRELNPSGVSLADLFGAVSNETPATLSMLGESVRELCLARELIKTGREGQKREPSTATKPDDVIRLSRQRSFSFA